MLLLGACGDGSDSGGGGSQPPAEPGKYREGAFSAVDVGVDGNGVSVTSVDVSAVVNGELTLPPTIEGQPVLAIGIPLVPGGPLGVNIFGRDAPDITGVVLPRDLLRIEDSAFSRTGLTSIEIPPTVTSIGRYAFSYTALSSIIIPDTVTSVGDFAFANIDTLTSVTLGSSSQKIGNSAFFNSKSLREIRLEYNTPPTLQGAPLHFEGTPFKDGSGGGTIHHPGIARQDFVDKGWIAAVHPNTVFVDTTLQP